MKCKNCGEPVNRFFYLFEPSKWKRGIHWVHTISVFDYKLYKEGRASPVMKKGWASVKGCTKPVPIKNEPVKRIFFANEWGYPVAGIIAVIGLIYSGATGNTVIMLIDCFLALLAEFGIMYMCE